MAEDALVRRVKAVEKPRCQAGFEPVRVDRHLDLVGLPDVAHVRPVAEAGARHLDPVLPDPGEQVRLERALLTGERPEVERVEAPVHRPHRVVQDVGGDGAEGAQRARGARHEDGGDAHLAGEEAAHQRARPAEGHQREVTLIDAGPGEDLGEGGVHVRHRDAHDALRRLVHAHAERIGVAADRLLGESGVEAHPAAEKSLGVEKSRDHEGVGERGVHAAAAITSRAGIGAGALRAHLGHADLVDPGDGAAARADRGDAHHRHHDGDAADLLGRAGARAAVLHHRDVRARPAHVESDEVAEPGGPGDVGGPDDAGGRAGQERGHGLPARRRDRHDPAVGLRDVRHRGHGARAERRLEPFEIAPHLRLHVGVEHGERRALVLARLGPHLMGGAHRDAGRRGLGHAPRAPLVGGVAIGVDQADHQPLGALVRQAAGRRGHAGLVEGGVDAAVGPEPLAHLGHAGPRDERLGAAAVHVERVRQPQPLDLQHVAEALGDEEAEPRPRPLDQRVHGDRGAVDGDVDLAQVDAVLAGEGVEAVLHRLGEVGRGGRDLQAGDAVGRRVIEREVGEGAADVDAEPVTPHAVLSLDPRLRRRARVSIAGAEGGRKRSHRVTLRRRNGVRRVNPATSWRR